MGNNNSSGCGSSIFFVLFLQVVFLALQAGGAVDWPTWAVWSPVIVGITLSVVFVVIFIIIGVLAELAD